jgi:hypothetical protein
MRSPARTTAALPAILGLLALPAASAAQEREPGTYWEQTVQMEAQGFAMPPTKQKVCVPLSGFQDPPGTKGSDDCKATDVVQRGSKMTWKMTCPASKMTGEGEMDHRGDSYSGKVLMKSPDGEMRMVMSGKKLGGDCDAGERKREAMAQLKKGQEMQAQAMAKSCDDAVRNLSVELFVGPAAMCKEPAQKSQFCAGISSRQGFTTLMKGGESRFKDAASFCGKDPAAIRAQNCASALKEDAVEFVGQYCPEQRNQLAQRECAGRDFTTVDRKYAAFCNRYAREMLEATAAQNKAKAKVPAPPKDPSQKAQDQAVDQGKKAVKGVFGF